LTERLQRAETAQQEMRQQVEDLERRLRAAENEDTPEQADPARRDELAAALADIREEELEARLQLRTAEERAQASAGAAARLRRSAQAERDARREAAERSARRAAGARLAERIAAVADDAIQRVEQAAGRAEARRDEASAQRAA